MIPDLQQLVKDFLNDELNDRIATELMDEMGYDKGNWTNWDGDLPFEAKGVVHHGGEGEGDDYWTVIEVRDPSNPDETLLVKLQGWYTSYNGPEYTDWRFVQPKQKTITVYQ